MNKPGKHKKEISKKQKLVFKLITALIPILILLLFEGILRIAGSGDNLDLFIKNPTEGYGNYMMVNPKIGKKYFQKFEYTYPPNDIFLKEKSENTFRIFVMGSSTVYGFPYERNIMFSRILHKQLENTYPNRNIEVVNTAITAINSFTLADFAGQISDYKPDAVLIYAGHNEFYGAFGIGSNETMSKNAALTKMHIALMDSKIYQMLRNGISSVTKNIAKKKGESKGTLMKRMVGKNDIILNSEEYKIAMKRYRQNMSNVLDDFKKENIPVFLSEVVSNINGMEPFSSVENENLEKADAVYKKAKNEEKNQNYSKAFQLYHKAKDLDCTRFRASEDVNQIINDLIAEYKVHKIPMLAHFQNNSLNKLIGNNLMTEHVHPNIEGNFLMAEAFYKGITESGIFGKLDGNISELGPGYFKRNYGYTSLDSIMGVHRIGILKGNWPFIKQSENEYNYLEKYRPKTLLDSLAFSTLRDKKRVLSDTRLLLAKRYKKDGRFYLAFKEYDALLQMNPYFSINYRDAASCLIELSDLPLALKYFQKSLKYEDSAFAKFKMGEILFFMGDYKSSLQKFEECFPEISDERKIIVLTKSYVSCVYGGQTAKAKAIANELKRVKADGNINNIPPKRYLFDQYIPYQTKEQVLVAKQLISENEDEKALKILESSLEIYDSHIANRLIGEIYLKQKNNNKAISYFEKVYGLFKFNTRFLHNLTMLYISEKDMANAQMCISQLKLIEPNYKYLQPLSLMVTASN